MHPARAFSTIENVAKARPRVIPEFLPYYKESLHQNEMDISGPRQIMLIIWPFELSELCRPVLAGFYQPFGRFSR